MSHSSAMPWKPGDATKLAAFHRQYAPVVEEAPLAYDAPTVPELSDLPELDTDYMDALTVGSTVYVTPSFNRARPFYGEIGAIDAVTGKLKVWHVQGGYYAGEYAAEDVELVEATLEAQRAAKTAAYAAWKAGELLQPSMQELMWMCS